MEVSGRGASFRPYTEKDQSKQCEQCEEDKLTVEATGFCSVCKDYLCDSCIQHHKKFRATKNHVVLLDINIPLQKPRIKEDESYEVSGQGGSIESGHAYGHGSDDSDVGANCNQTDKDMQHQSKVIAKVNHDVLKDTKDVEQKIKEIKITQTQQQRTKPDVHLKRASHQTKDGIAKKKDDDQVFETFYHRSGKEFQCIYQSGMRFYLDDWGSKEWQRFPKRWYNEGLLVTNSILKDDSTEVQQPVNSSSQSAGVDQLKNPTGGQQGDAVVGGDDREGFILHPTRGRIPTYIYYKKHNVHMYFDRDTGSWVRMPIGWELHHPMVKTLVDQVQTAVPSWGDRHDILALLRACNYDPDECINIYLHLQGDEWLKPTKTGQYDINDEGQCKIKK